MLNFWLAKFNKKIKIGITGLNPHCESIDKFNEDKISDKLGPGHGQSYTYIRSNINNWLMFWHTINLGLFSLLFKFWGENTF